MYHTKRKRNYISEKEMRNYLCKRITLGRGTNYNDTWKMSTWSYATGDGEKVINLAKKKRLTVDEWHTLCKHYIPRGTDATVWVPEMTHLLAGLPDWSDKPEEMAMRFAMIYDTVLEDVYMVKTKPPDKYLSRIEYSTYYAKKRIDRATELVWSHFNNSRSISKLIQMHQVYPIHIHNDAPGHFTQQQMRKIWDPEPPEGIEPSS